MSVVEIPGVGSVEFPDSMSQDQITAAVQKMVKPGQLAGTGTLQRGASGQVAGSTFQPAQRPRQPATGGQTFQRSLLERAAGNVANLPRMLMQGSGLMTDTNDMSLTGVQRPNIAPVLDVPTVSGPQALSGILGGTKTIMQGRPIQETFQESMDESQAVRQDNPAMAMLGDFGGDAMSVLMGRAPMTRMGPNRATNATTDIIAPKLKPVFQKALRSESADVLSRAAGRSLEAGFEGATLAMLQDGDPVETATFAAASQIPGLVGLKLSEVDGLTDLLRGKVIKGGTKLAGSALALGAVIQTLKESTPGGRDFILESIESGFEKVPLAVALGVLSGMTGAGRVKGGQLPAVKFDLPGVVMDAMSTIPRTGTISAIKSIVSDETGNSERAINTLISNPGAFSRGHLEALQKAMEGGDVSGAVGKLYEEDEKFREILDAPDPRLAGVPKISDRTP